MTGNSKKHPEIKKEELDFWTKMCSHVLDELDIKIYMYLRENGRMTDSEIAEKLGVSPSTVRRRRIAMEEKGILRIIGVLIYQKTRLAYADVLVKFKTGTPPEEVEKLVEEGMHHFNIFEIAKYLGRYDLLLRFVDKDLESLREKIVKFLERPYIEEYLILPITLSPKAFDVRLLNHK